MLNTEKPATNSMFIHVCVLNSYYMNCKRSCDVNVPTAALAPRKRPQLKTKYTNYPQVAGGPEVSSSEPQTSKKGEGSKEKETEGGKEEEAGREETLNIAASVVNFYGAQENGKTEEEGADRGLGGGGGGSGGVGGSGGGGVEEGGRGVEGVRDGCSVEIPSYAPERCAGVVGEAVPSATGESVGGGENRPQSVEELVATKTSPAPHLPHPLEAVSVSDVFGSSDEERSGGE